ncbi:YheC/YheD family protein [Paenibacillus sp. FJAT-26967]|uniref:YheC/YheD family endospore coat-associated protein n=1 Tax=Paenibacillus sp. FJAT-26967 TaxID=1729690 RepID=UPI000837FE7E|nr:YheC/YheD family protein [Paenibacillus sp. FJAT-26967]
MGGAANRCLGVLAASDESILSGDSEPFLRKLCLLGAEEGVDVIVFTPDSVSWEKNSVNAYHFLADTARWEQGHFLLPPIIYDRCFCSSPADLIVYRRLLAQLRDQPGIRLLGGGLRGKWDVQRLLAADSVLRPHLALTCMLRTLRQLQAWLHIRSEAFLKPEAGTHGKGTLHIAQLGKNSSLYRVKGRDRSNRLIELEFTDTPALFGWIRKFVEGRRYLLQEYLPLTTADGTAYDVRSLMQKNGRGSWELTGTAVRCGDEGSVTSNLHGGGSSCEADPFLQEQFGRSAASGIIDTISALSYRIPLVLESSHGRLAELGIDYGVCRDGRIRILEVNSKPGRAAFRSLSGGETARLAVCNPVRYAAFLLKSQRAAAGATSLGG